MYYFDCFFHSILCLWDLSIVAANSFIAFQYGIPMYRNNTISLSIMLWMDNELLLGFALQATLLWLFLYIYPEVNNPPPFQGYVCTLSGLERWFGKLYIVNFTRKMPKHFPQWLYQFILSEETYESFLLLHIFANIWYYQTSKNVCQSVRQTMILHCSFTLHLPGYLWGCLKHWIFISLLV